MFTYNRNLGVGKVEKIENGKATIAYEEKTVELLAQFVKFYNSYEEAEENEAPLTEEEVNSILAEIAEENKIIEEGKKAQFEIEKRNREASEQLAKNI